MHLDRISILKVLHSPDGLTEWNWNSHLSLIAKLIQLGFPSERKLGFCFKSLILLF